MTARAFSRLSSMAVGLGGFLMFLVQPMIAGHGPTLYQGGLPATRRLELISATPFSNGVVAMHYRRAG